MLPLDFFLFFFFVSLDAFVSLVPKSSGAGTHSCAFYTSFIPFIWYGTKSYRNVLYLKSLTEACVVDSSPGAFKSSAAAAA